MPCTNASRTLDGQTLLNGPSGRSPVTLAAFDNLLAQRTADLSHPLLGHPATPLGGAFLAALPMVKATAVQTNSSDVPVVNVARPAGGATVTTYTLSGAITASAKSPSTTEEFPLARVGSRVDWPAIDQGVTPAPSTDNRAAMNVRLAAVGVLGELARQLVAGTGASGELKGLDTIISDLGGHSTASLNIEQDIREVLANVRSTTTGAGARTPILLAGPKTIRTIQSSTGGRGGTSGFGVDPCTGLWVYRYLGLPIYEAQVDETTTGTLYGLDVGPRGAFLAYTLGTEMSFGLAIDDLGGATAAPGNRETVVHGAWSLVLQDTDAIWRVTGITFAL